jgi:purine-nucleoside phosphorylase
MSETYDKSLIELARVVAKESQIKLQEGVYFGLTGPCFETPAEYRFIRKVGADTVGMSTVPEVIVARHGGMKVFAMSIITDLGIEGQVVKITHEEVQAAANKAEPIMTFVMKEMIRKLDLVADTIKFKV